MESWDKILIRVGTIILILVFTLSLFNFVKIYDTNSVNKKPTDSQSANVPIKPQPKMSPDYGNNEESPIPENSTNEFEEEVEVSGVLRKEKIPEEMELGDFWYWLYFDEPFLLKHNAFGLPRYIDKIQLITYDMEPYGDDHLNLEDYIDKKVKIYGTLTWGYSESRVLQVIAVTEME